jgi:hypothetical protein
VDLTKIVANSFKYPFRNIAKLPIICILFVLISIVPFGMIFDNRYIVLIGAIAFFAFILIVPGYLLSIVRKGSIGSSAMPSLSLVDNLYDSIKVIALRAVYMIVPTAVFLIFLSTLGPASIDMLFNLKILEFLATFGLTILLILVTYIVFEFLLFFAKARLAYFNSLSEALKINRVISDIRNIGFFTIIKWIIIMAILINVISFVTSFVMSIPYVGFLIYIGVVIPIIESIGNYSLGLLYSNIAKNNADYNLKKIRG